VVVNRAAFVDTVEAKRHDLKILYMRQHFIRHVDLNIQNNVDLRHKLPALHGIELGKTWWDWAGWVSVD